MDENGTRVSRPIFAWLWLLAGLAAVVLLLATGLLYLESQTGADSFSGVVGGPPGAVYLRSRPHPGAAVVTILEPGDPLLVRTRRDEDGVSWYRVESEQGQGWLPEDRVERRE